MASLDRTERLLSRLIRAPRGVQSALDADASGELSRSLAEVVVSDDRASAVHRLDVYANAYFFRIHDCLLDDFAALGAALGPEAWNDLVASYLLAHPSRFPSIAEVGHRLPGFIREHANAAWVRGRFPFAADLAELELAIQRAFDREDLPTLSREDLARVPPDRFGDLSLALDPAVLLLRLGWPVSALRRAHDSGEPLCPDALARGEQHVLVWRQAERVSYRPLEPLEAAVLRALEAGQCFADLVARTAEESDEDEAPVRVATWLARWISDGCLTKTPLPGAPPE